MKILITKSYIIILLMINNSTCGGFYINNQTFVEPHEVQHAECTVTAGEVRASAEAKTTKTLKGVCGSDEMKKIFEDLELKIEKKFEELKVLLNLNGIIKYDRNVTFSSSNSNHQTETTNRYAEIERLNKTIISDEELKIFSYYWKIENFTEKLNNYSYPTEYSPLFSIFGKTFNIQATFKYLGRDFLHLRLQVLSIEQQSKNKFISLNTETGNIFKNIHNLVFKHKIAILNQENSMKDLVSQELINMSDGITIPNSVLLSNAYLKDDIILIKIYIYF